MSDYILYDDDDVVFFTAKDAWGVLDGMVLV